LPYLVFDTETTGLLQFDRPDDAPDQPRLASYALLFVDDDLRVTDTHYGLVSPKGWAMPAEAERVNGLTTEMLEVAGDDVWVPIHFFREAIDDCRILVAHNLEFDRRIMRGEMLRLDWPGVERIPSGLCTMRALTKACAIPRPCGGGYKWPKLHEAVSILLARELHGAHGALADAMGCLDLLRWMKAQGIIPQMGETV
jgi:DNA polymerase III epsilon subunit-like protein